MKLLIVTKGLRYHRFFAPVVSTLLKRLQKLDISLITPDPENFSRIETTLPYELLEMVDPGSLSTKILRRIRPLFAYLNWLLLDVQSEEILDNKSDKFLLSSLGNLTSVIKPHYIRRVTEVLVSLKLNRFFAQVGLALSRFFESSIPVDRNIVTQIQDLGPDIILVTPAIHWRSYELDYVRAGFRMGIPTITLIGSWDHLTTKGLLSVISDCVLVWNEDQVQELQQ